MPEELHAPDKGGTALSLLTHQLGRPVSSAHVSLQTVLCAKLLFTARLLTEEGFLFLMDNLDVGGQVPLSYELL